MVSGSADVDPDDALRIEQIDVRAVGDLHETVLLGRDEQSPLDHAPRSMLELDAKVAETVEFAKRRAELIGVDGHGPVRRCCNGPASQPTITPRMSSSVMIRYSLPSTVTSLPA